MNLAVAPLDAQAARAARERIDRLTKPLGSLGRLETLAVQLCAIAGGMPTDAYERRAVIVGAGDHGVAAHGVSAYPSAVTVQMIAGFLGGTAAISAIARSVGADVSVVNFGVATALDAHPALLDVPVGLGTADLSQGPAMSARELDAALGAGARAFEWMRERTNADVVALGEMGIGNTTSAAALIAAFTGASAHAVVGRGTGIDDERLARKRAIVDGAAARVRGADARTVAADLGGFEIAGLAGAIIAAARARVPVVLDGVIVGAAALVARALAPDAIGYCIAAHRSHEPGHAVALDALGLEPLFDLQLRLGEGSGAALALPFVSAAARMIREMRTFEEAGVSTASQPAAAGR